MYKSILAAVTVLSLSSFAQADQNRIWDCVNTSTLKADQTCVAENFEVNSFNTEFFNDLAYKDFSGNKEVYASIVLDQNKNLITIKPIAIEDKEVLLANQ
jgi:hypothetical protein